MAELLPHPLPGHPVDEMALAAHHGFGARVDAEAVLRCEPDTPDETGGVIFEDRGADCPDELRFQVLLPAERVYEPGRRTLPDVAEVDRHGVDGEVPAGEIGFDGAADGGEIKVPLGFLGGIVFR